MLRCAQLDKRSAQRSVPDETRGVLVPGLAALRKRAGLSQKELAARSGVTRQTISRLEQGGHGYYDTIDKLAKALRISRKRLLEEITPQRPRHEPQEEGL